MLLSFCTLLSPDIFKSLSFCKLYLITCCLWTWGTLKNYLLMWHLFRSGIHAKTTPISIDIWIQSTCMTYLVTTIEKSTGRTCLRIWHQTDWTICCVVIEWFKFRINTSLNFRTLPFILLPLEFLPIIILCLILWSIIYHLILLCPTNQRIHERFIWRSNTIPIWKTIIVTNNLSSITSRLVANSIRGGFRSCFTIDILYICMWF